MGHENIPPRVSILTVQLLGLDTEIEYISGEQVEVIHRVENWGRGGAMKRICDFLRGGGVGGMRG